MFQYSFLLQAVSHFRFYCYWKDYGNGTFQWYHRENKLQLSVLWCSAWTNSVTVWLVYKREEISCLCPTKYTFSCSQWPANNLCLTSMSAGHILTSHTFKIHINTTFSPAHISSKWCLRFKYSGETFLRLFLIWHACHILNPSCPR
jgi:hypothetical protein